MMLPAALRNAIARLVEAMPAQALAGLLPVLDCDAVQDWQPFKQAAQRSVPSQADLRSQVGLFMDSWRREAPGLQPNQMLGALTMAADMLQRERQRQVLELVWTGPRSTQPLRQTAQALAQVIDEAQQTLLVVSFAVYDIPEIVTALTNALNRGVSITLVLETIDRNSSSPYDRLAAFGSHLRHHITVYEWPLAKRPRNDQGQHGLLHVKCAVADEQALFLSSANLTQYALILNIEMGILVHGGPLPQHVRQHFSSLMQTEVLVQTQ